MVTFEEVQKAHKQFVDLMFNHWLFHDLFTWQWWVLFGLTIIPWIVWWKLVDKGRVKEILIFGLLVAMIATLLDMYGWSRYAWTYPLKFLPIPVPLVPINDSVLPVLHMFIYQYFRTWRSFLWAELVMAIIFAYIAEPALIWMGIYKPISWKFIYSIPPYVGNAILGRWITEKINKSTVN